MLKLYKMSRILNPRTNRYVTLGSPSYRKLVREGTICDEIEDNSKKRSKRYEYDQDNSKTIPLAQKKEIIRKSVNVISKHEDKFKKVKDQDECDKLLIKLLLKKVSKGERKSTKEDSSSDTDSSY